MERHRRRQIIIQAAATAIVLACTYRFAPILPSADRQGDGRRSLRPMSYVLDPRTVVAKSPDAAYPVVGEDDVPSNAAGPWTAEEHDLFLRGLANYGPASQQAWRKISRHVLPTRTAEQVRDHWREYYDWNYNDRRDDPDHRPPAWARSAAAPVDPPGDVPPADDPGDVPSDLGDDRWSEEEHDLFLEALASYGAKRWTWGKISRDVLPTRSEDEVRDHWREYQDWYRSRRDDPDYLPTWVGSAAAPADPPGDAPPDSGGVPSDLGDDRWSEGEHGLFLEGLGEYGRGPGAYEAIADAFAGTRSFEQVREHADEYFAGLARGDRAPSEIFAWPPEGDVDVPPGTYFFDGKVLRWKDLLRDYRIAPDPGYGRVLLYISTHFSYQHILYLRYCWKNVLARSPLLQEADVAVHLNPNDKKRRKAAMDLLKDVFAGHNLMVYVRDYKDAYLEGGTKGKPLIKVKQSGAVMAMYEGVHHGYFEGYDWVVRVNPDVLIRDDAYFRRAMANPDLSALLVNCHNSTNLHLHTDFFVVRPGVLKEEEFPREIRLTGAELSFTKSLRRTVLNVRPQIYEWIPGAGPLPREGCRVGAGRDFYESPVVHEHYLHPDICTVPEKDMKIVNNQFPTGWPENWAPVNRL